MCCSHGSKRSRFAESSSNHVDEQFGRYAVGSLSQQRMPQVQETRASRSVEQLERNRLDGHLLPELLLHGDQHANQKARVYRVVRQTDRVRRGCQLFDSDRTQRHHIDDDRVHSLRARLATVSALFASLRHDRYLARSRSLLFVCEMRLQKV